MRRSKSAQNSHMPEGKHSKGDEDDDSDIEDERASSVFTRLRRDAMSREDAFKQKKLMTLYQIPKETKVTIYIFSILFVNNMSLQSTTYPRSLSE